MGSRINCLSYAMFICGILLDISILMILLVTTTNLDLLGFVIYGFAIWGIIIFLPMTITLLIAQSYYIHKSKRTDTVFNTKSAKMASYITICIPIILALLIPYQIHNAKIQQAEKDVIAKEKWMYFEQMYSYEEELDLKAAREKRGYDQWLQDFKSQRKVLGVNYYIQNQYSEEYIGRLHLEIKNEQGEIQTISFFGESPKIQEMADYINNILINKEIKVVLIDRYIFENLLKTPILSSQKTLLMLGGLLDETDASLLSKRWLVNGKSIIIPTGAGTNKPELYEAYKLYIPAKIYVDGELLNDKFE